MQVRARRFPRKDAIIWGAAAGVLSTILLALRWRSDVLFSYDTTTPYKLFLTGAMISAAVQFIVLAALAAVLVGTVFAIRPQTRTLFAGGHERRYLRDALLLAGLGLVLQVGIRRFSIVLNSFADRYTTVNELLMLPAAARPWPWLDDFTGLVRYSILLLPVLALVVHAAVKFFGTRRALLAFAGAIALFAAEDARSVPQFGVQLVVGLVSAAALVWVLMGLFRGNELAYVLSFFAGRALGLVLGWLRQPALEARTTGVVLALLAAALLVVIYLLAARGARTAARSSIDRAA
jgi:hypothetical protein